MAGQYLMERAGERMNVSPDKLAEYLANGWKVLKTPDENKAVVVVDQPVVEIPDAPEGPKASEEPEAPKVVKRSRKVK